MTPARNWKPRGSQRGRGSLGCLFSLLLLSGLGYLGYKFVPPYVSHFQLKDALDEFAVYEVAGAGVARKEKGDTVDAVIRKAHELGVHLERQDVKIDRNTDKIIIHVNYMVPIDLPTGVYQLKFDFTSHN